MPLARFDFASVLLPVAALLSASCTLLPVSREHPIAPGDEPRFVAPAAPVKWALVLSSGAMRGFAHVGVIRELRAAGLEPDLIVGASVGAAVGTLAASGLDDERLAEAAQAIGMKVFGDPQISRFGIIGGGGIHEFIDRFSRYRSIEKFPIRFAAVAVEAERSCLEIFNAGDAGRPSRPPPASRSFSPLRRSAGTAISTAPSSVRCPCEWRALWAQSAWSRWM